MILRLSSGLGWQPMVRLKRQTSHKAQVLVIMTVLVLLNIEYPGPIIIIELKVTPRINHRTLIHLIVKK